MTPLIGEPTPLPPPWPAEIIEALEQARQILGQGRDLAKGHAIDWDMPATTVEAAKTLLQRAKSNVGAVAA